MKLMSFEYFFIDQINNLFQEIILSTSIYKILIRTLFILIVMIIGIIFFIKTNKYLWILLVQKYM